MSRPASSGSKIEADARPHDHRDHAEIDYVLNCAAGAAVEPGGEPLAAAPGGAVPIPPGVRHRAAGRMTTRDVAVPPVDPADGRIERGPCFVFARA